MVDWVVLIRWLWLFVMGEFNGWEKRVIYLMSGKELRL